MSMLKRQTMRRGRNLMHTLALTVAGEAASSNLHALPPLLLRSSCSLKQERARDPSQDNELFALRYSVRQRRQVGAARACCLLELNAHHPSWLPQRVVLGITYMASSFCFCYMP